jgi:hypothetical protein
VFLRTDNIKDCVQTGFEIQVLNSYGKEKLGRNDCASLYDCLAPSKNALTKVGEWQKFHITFKGNMLTVEVNGQKVLEANLDKWTEAGKNPPPPDADGQANKFKKLAYKDMAQEGYIGLQFHGDPITYRNIKVKPLTEPKKGEDPKPAEKK